MDDMYGGKVGETLTKIMIFLLSCLPIVHAAKSSQYDTFKIKSNHCSAQSMSWFPFHQYGLVVFGTC